MTPSQIRHQAAVVAREMNERIRGRVEDRNGPGWTFGDAELLASIVGTWVAQEVRREMTQLVCSACGSAQCEEAVTWITRAEYLTTHLGSNRMEQSELPEEESAPAYNVFEDYDPMKGEI